MENENKINKDNFIHMVKDSLTDYYKIIKIIGKGGYSKVYEVQNQKTSKLLACKKISKINIIDLQKFKNEINIMCAMDHPNIVKFYEVYESNRSLYLIMELCKGSPLFKKITEKAIQKKKYTEKDAAKIFQNVISALEYSHNVGICHRDLKPENILYLNDNNDEKNPLKLINFIFSRHFKINKLTSKVGSVYYIAPEVLDRKYTEKCDIWSAGVLLYLLLSGSLPFNGSEESEIFAKIKSFKYDMDNKIWENISNEAKDLIKHIFVPENERYSAKEVLAHPWFKIVNDIKDKPINIDFNFFKKYSEENTLKKIVLHFITSRLNEKEIENLKDLFKKFDKNSDGQISYEEFEKGFIEYQNKNHLFNQNDIKNIFNIIDINKNGKIDYSEFIATSLVGRKEIIERRLLEAFATFDKNQSGKIKKEDFIKALNIDTSLKEKGLEKFIDDLTQDDMVDYNKFLELMNK